MSFYPIIIIVIVIIIAIVILLLLVSKNNSNNNSDNDNLNIYFQDKNIQIISIEKNKITILNNFSPNFSKFNFYIKRDKITIRNNLSLSFVENHIIFYANEFKNNDLIILYNDNQSNKTCRNTYKSYIEELSDSSINSYRENTNNSCKEEESNSNTSVSFERENSSEIYGNRKIVLPKRISLNNYNLIPSIEKKIPLINKENSIIANSDASSTNNKSSSYSGINSEPLLRNNFILHNEKALSTY